MERLAQIGRRKFDYGLLARASSVGPVAAPLEADDLGPERAVQVEGLDGRGSECGGGKMGELVDLLEHETSHGVGVESKGHKLSLCAGRGEIRVRYELLCQLRNPRRRTHLGGELLREGLGIPLDTVTGYGDHEIALLALARTTRLDSSVRLSEGDLERLGNVRRGGELERVEGARLGRREVERREDGEEGHFLREATAGSDGEVTERTETKQAGHGASTAGEVGRGERVESVLAVKVALPPRDGAVRAGVHLLARRQEVCESWRRPGLS